MFFGFGTGFVSKLFFETFAGFGNISLENLDKTRRSQTTSNLETPTPRPPKLWFFGFLETYSGLWRFSPLNFVFFWRPP